VASACARAGMYRNPSGPSVRPPTKTTVPHASNGPLVNMTNDGSCLYTVNVPRSDALDAIARVDNEWAFDLCPQNER